MDITMTGVSRNNFVSLKGNLTTAIAESIGTDKDIIELPIRYQNGNEKKDVNEQPISRVIIKVTEDIDMVAVWKTTNDTSSITKDLTTSMKMHAHDRSAASAALMNASTV